MKTRNRSFQTARIIPIAAVLFLIPLMNALIFADDATESIQLVEKARMSFENFLKAGEMEAFRNLLKEARGVFIAPQILKGAFIIGASGGSGVFLARDRETGKWAGPAFYTMGEASFGFQAGGQSSEVILLAMTERGVTSLLASSLKLGADVGVAAGPVGVGAAASTANLSADIISFARSKGLYGGISLDGAIVKVREKLNNAYYKKKVTPVDILVSRTAVSQESSGLIEAISKEAGGK